MIEGLLLQPSMNRIMNGSKRTAKGEFTRFGYIQRTAYGYVLMEDSEFIMSDLAMEGGEAADGLEQEYGKANEDGTFTVTII